MKLNNTKFKKLLFLQFIIFVLLPLYLFAVSPEDQAQIDLAKSLDKQAHNYYENRRYGEAEPLYKRSLEINEKVYGPDHPYVALSLNNLGLLYNMQERYAEAGQLIKRSLEIWEKAFGPENTSIETSLNLLGFFQ